MMFTTDEKSSKVHKGPQQPVHKWPQLQLQLVPCHKLLGGQSRCTVYSVQPRCTVVLKQSFPLQLMRPFMNWLLWPFVEDTAGL